MQRGSFFFKEQVFGDLSYFKIHFSIGIKKEHERCILGVQKSITIAAHFCFNAVFHFLALFLIFPIGQSPKLIV